MIKEKFPRNFNIEERFQDEYAELQKHELFEEATNLEIFLMSMALGSRNGHREPLDEPYPVVNVQTISQEKAWVVAAVAMKAEGFGVLRDFKEIRKVAEEYANGGFHLLKDKIEDGPPGSELERIQTELLELMQD